MSSVKVIGVGLGRTGTMSLSSALDILGFGPCYHLFKVSIEGRQDLGAWNRLTEKGSREGFDELLQGYSSVVDYPAAIAFEQLYAAYPDAKYILTIRDPVKWERSLRSTLLMNHEEMKKRYSDTPRLADYMYWFDHLMLEKYHQGRLETHTQQEMLDHNERVKKLIPPDQLLVFEVKDGWEKLANFLGVPIPTEPLPHLNDSEWFKAFIDASKEKRHA